MVIKGNKKENTASITINGQVYKGANISIQNGVIKIDGNNVGTSQEDLVLTINGDVANIKSDRRIEVFGDVHGNVDAGGSVECRNVNGSVDAGGSIKCGNVGANADAGGSITCNDINGNADVGGSIISR